MEQVKTAHALSTAKSRKASVSSSSPDLQSIVFQEIQTVAQPVATANHLPNLVPVNEGSLGDLPWFWESGQQFTDATFAWLNNIFSFSSDGYVSAEGDDLTTSYANVLRTIAYKLDPPQTNQLNEAILAAQTIVDTLVTDYTTFMGPFQPGLTQAAELNIIETTVLGWGNPGLTLAQLRTSTNPGGLLPNVPLGASQIVSDLMSYLNATNGVAAIQNALQSFNAQVRQSLNNVNPAQPPTEVLPGWMETIDLQIVPEMSVQELPPNIQNALLPQQGTGTSISAQYTATVLESGQLQITTSSGSGVGDLGFFLTFTSQNQSSQNLFSMDTSLTTCSVTLTFNGVTTFTPVFDSYDVSTGVGWWNPAPIQGAVNSPWPNASGYTFDPTPPFDFQVNGNFGVISALLISQQPVITLTYTTTDSSAFTNIFQQSSSWGVEFLGIPLGGGSQTFFQATTSQDIASSTVTLTMSPAGLQTPISQISQLAYVIGAEILWPGEGTTS